MLVLPTGPFQSRSLRHLTGESLLDSLVLDRLVLQDPLAGLPSRARLSSRGRCSSRARRSSRGRQPSRTRRSSRGRDPSRGQHSSRGRHSLPFLKFIFSMTSFFFYYWLLMST